MIQGLKINKLFKHSDERGFFMELLRDDDQLLSRFGQLSLSETKPGLIKAFHWHNHQDDIWYVLSGNAKIVLYDRRKESPTYKQTQVFFAGEDHDPILLVIPIGVAHGYQVLGDKPLQMLYIMNTSYSKEQPDEQRIPHDHPEIGFNWEETNGN